MFGNEIGMKGLERGVLALHFAVVNGMVFLVLAVHRSRWTALCFSTRACATYDAPQSPRLNSLS